MPGDLSRLFIGSNDYYLKIPCGHCRLCRKKRANDWKVRLYKEFEGLPTHIIDGKENPRVLFITLTFSDEHYTDDESLFPPWLVKFRDNYRKRFGNSPRYWCSTDRGSRYGRVHAHMLIFNPHVEDRKHTFVRYVTNKELHDLNFWWPYGFVYSQWVKKGYCTCNYVVGYVTGVNNLNKAKKHGYTICDKSLKYQPKLYVSKGIGKCYDTYENMNYHKSRKPVIDLNGYVYALPRYYRLKWWSPYERWLDYCTRQFDVVKKYVQMGYDSDFIDTIFHTPEVFEYHLMYDNLLPLLYEYSTSKVGFDYFNQLRIDSENRYFYNTKPKPHLDNSIDLSELYKDDNLYIEEFEERHWSAFPLMPIVEDDNEFPF